MRQLVAALAVAGICILTAGCNEPGWACGRALAQRNNVVIDVNTCSANPADSAVNIANQIAAKVQPR
jgi:hypothetical protein